jgi:hypothetical protein
VLVDSARRFVPVETLMNIIDGMAYTKMNALRLHVADYMRVRVIPDGFGMLNKSAEGGWYSLSLLGEAAFFSFLLRPALFSFFFPSSTPCSCLFPLISFFLHLCFFCQVHRG